MSVLALLLLQLGQIGRQTPASQPAPTALVQPVQPIIVTQPAPLPTAQPGHGAIKFTSRVVEPRYEVAAGDTLGSISARFGTTVDAIQSINNLADRNVLSVGQRLVIPNQE